MGNKIERLTNASGFNLQSNGEGKNLFVANESLCDPRKERIERWRDAPEDVKDYSSGTAKDRDGSLYYYEQGTRLIIGDPQRGEAIEVMDTCETPWAFATVNRAFEELGSKSGQVDVLERGFGMGITARRAIQNLVPRGGSYTVIELNRQNAAYAKNKWRLNQISALASMASGMPGTKPHIVIEIIEGDAYEETAKLAEKEKKFDIIISDTFPLNEDEQGINDLQDLATLKRCLKPGGIFTFFAYFPGLTGGIMKNQRDMINEHFGSYAVTEVIVNPPPDYKYLQTEVGPVRNLPVVICKVPKI